jgi:hypothetical protein
MRFNLHLILILLALGLFLPRAQAQDEVNLDYFYTSLQDQGDWFSTDTFGYVFQPKAATDPNWRPYTDGYWSFTDEGWTWMSYEDFGWATYHYGRWTKLASVGWVWVPGYEWAPAWVSWRTSADLAEDAPDAVDQPGDPESDFIGWAPLPPNAILYPGVGLVGGIDHIYDIPPEYYCFVPTPYFCAPALIVVIVVPARNYFCIGRTINVTHCHFGDRAGVPHIYCGGPSLARVQRRVPRPIPQFTIARRPGVPSVGRGSPAILNQVRGRTLEVIAPRIAPPAGVSISTVGVPRNASSPRPTRIKAEIARAERVPAWYTAGVQPQAVQAAREQYKREAAQAPRVAVANPSGVATNPPRPIPNTTVPAGSAPAGSYPSPHAGRVTQAPAAPAAAASAETAPISPQDAYRRQQAAERARRQQIIADQQRGAGNEPPNDEDAVEAQRRSQSEAQARMQAVREQQAEQTRQTQAAAQAQKQQQLEAQRQAQMDRQRRAQAENQARAEAQREVARQQQQADQQRRAAEAQRRMEAARGAAQGTQTP